MKHFYLALIFLSITVNAQPGVLDNSFNSGDSGLYKSLRFSNSGGTDHVASTPVLLPNGKVVVISHKDLKIYRFNADCTVDVTFQPLSYGEEDDTRYDKLFLQTDGKILALDSMSKKIIRLNEDGSIDATFTPPVFPSAVSPSTYINRINFQADGKILITGTFSSVNGIPQKNFTRLNTNGSVDTTFNMGTGFNQATSSAVAQPDGKIIVVGHFTSYNTTYINKIIRLNPDGSVDPTLTYGSGSSFYYQGAAFDVKLLPSGKILVIGTEDLYVHNNLMRRGIVRLNSNGSYDTTFSVQSFTPAIQEGFTEFAVQPDGKILVYKEGYPEADSQNYYRLNSDGSKDTSFTSTMVYLYGHVNRLIVQPDGKIIIGGPYRNPITGITRNVMHRVNSDGSLDISFMPNHGANNKVFRSFVQQDGKILLIGSFTTYQDQYAPGMARVDINGNLDTSFAIDPSIKIVDNVDAYPVIKQQADGKILIAGTGYTVNGVVKNIIRLHANGTIDQSFDCMPGNILDFEILSDGKIIASGIAGSFYENGAKLLRLNSNGAIEGSVGFKFNQAPISLEILPDGKILAAGRFNLYNNISTPKLIRLNADGTKDTSFNYTLPPGVTNSNVDRTIQLNDGKVLISFTNINTGKASIARLNGDGSHDTSFTVNAGTVSGSGYYGFKQMILLENGQILVPRYKYYANFNSLPSPNVILLDSDGTWNTAFDVPSFDDDIPFYSLAGCNRLIVTGDFELLGSLYKNNIAAVNVSPNPVPPSGASIQYANPGETLADLDVSGQNILWYMQPPTCENTYNALYTARSSDETDNVAPLSPTTPLVNGNTYYCTQTVNTLESLFALPVKVIFGTPAGTEDYETAPKVTLYPNPTDGVLKIDSATAFSHIYIYNTVGQLVLSKRNNIANAEIDMSHLNSGMYIIKLESVDAVSTHSVIRK
ncbi:T9SS type A sorting domain-containing protein [Flavobacterium sp. J372]|uniref:T9SS type A sorting domain-containing protein n=1 Tax=Flavobacterium sp. J372 TaxID=2898436 RepID=UPI0021513CF5|nr:T9SS type A sorting domain-containing protein [Flavobacterium sp. J372]MCR5860863.1 T9SS type A sorting domain-containing protein [Flavobacterium sp. J372]